MAQQTTTTTQSEPSGGAVVSRGIKLVGEAVVAPGSSLILDGKIVAGGAHFIGGMLARVALGPLGWFLVAANSYTKSVTGNHLHEHLQGAGKG